MAAMSYEESRKQRLEENKRRMEELGLMNLATDLKKPKIPKKKPEKRKIELQEARRSSRVAAKPVVVYREQLQRVKGAKERRGLRRRYLTEAAREAAVEAAGEVLKDIENPAFVKPMLHSHTSSVFWLGLPADFCKEHMPLTDEKLMLEDEKEKEWDCMYLAHKTGMSGWRGFSIDHDLMDGDCCIFELVRPLRFKVRIVRFADEDDEDEDDEDESDGKKPRSRKTRKLSRSSSRKKFEIGYDEEDEDDEEDEEDEEDDEDEEEFDSDVCDDHVSDEEEVDEDSEDDYSLRLSEKEVDTLVAATSRASRVLKRKGVKEESDGSEGQAES